MTSFWSCFECVPCCSPWAGPCRNRSQLKHLVLRTDADLRGIEVFEGFTEKVERLMYEVQDHHVGKQTQAILENGIVESQTLLDKGKAIFGFARPQNIAKDKAHDHLANNSPFVFPRKGHEDVALVRAWPISVQRPEFQKRFQIHRVNNAQLTDKQQLATADFKQMLNRLFEEEVSESSIFLCQQDPRLNLDLVLVGAVDDLVSYLSNNPKVMQYFGVWRITHRSIQVHMGICRTKEFKFADHSVLYALYIRSAKQDHACVQNLAEFCDEKELGKKLIQTA